MRRNERGGFNVRDLGFGFRLVFYLDLVSACVFI
jgi:hypothetical protein